MQQSLDNSTRPSFERILSQIMTRISQFGLKKKQPTKSSTRPGFKLKTQPSPRYTDSASTYCFLLTLSVYSTHRRWKALPYAAIASGVAAKKRIAVLHQEINKSKYLGSPNFDKRRFPPCRDRESTGPNRHPNTPCSSSGKTFSICYALERWRDRNTKSQR